MDRTVTLRTGYGDVTVREFEGDLEIILGGTIIGVLDGATLDDYDEDGLLDEIDYIMRRQ